MKTINEIAREYGVHPMLVGQWKKEILERAGTLSEGERGPKPQETHESEDRLHGEIGRLKMEPDWLKKSPDYEREIQNGLDRTRRGRALDNIFVERLWRSVKHEDVYLKGYATMGELTLGLAHHFAFYNGERPQQLLGF